MASKKPSRRNRKGPLRRMPSTAISAVEIALESATNLLVPDDQTQRKAFEALMPYLYKLRSKGCSWAQLTNLLNESGFALQSSTVQGYYSEKINTRKSQDDQSPLYPD